MTVDNHLPSHPSHSSRSLPLALQLCAHLISWSIVTLVEGLPATRPAALSIYDSSSTLASVLGDDAGYFTRSKKLGRQRLLELGLSPS